jgi:hypothetical protein
LGTYDLVAGISFVSKGWLVAAGYQMPFNRNDNQFLWGPWVNPGTNAGTKDSAMALRYPVCKQVKRGNDIMFRVEKNFRFSRFNAFVGILPIYRITEDEITDKFGNRVRVEGTKGIATSLLGGFGYNFSVRSGIKFAFGYRVMQRYREPKFMELSIDGLSREFVNTIGYEFRF